MSTPRSAKRSTRASRRRGAFYAMIPIEADDDMQWCKDAVRDAGVGLVPGRAFGTPGYVRASLVSPVEEIEAAVDRLASEGFI
jgi:aspartate aminotransferase